MKKLFLFLIIGVFTATLCSCATIMKDDTQTIPIKANVDKVNLKIMNKVGETVFEGQTPTMITLKTAAGGYFNPEKIYRHRLQKGYQTKESLIDWHVSGWYFAGNLVIGGILGYLIIDPLTGNMYYLDEAVNLNMTPIR